MRSIQNIATTCIAGAVLSLGLMGCQAEQRPDFIPSNAQLMDSGNGKVHYTAPDDGTVYIYDEPAKKLVWSGNVLKGQALDVDPIKNQIISNGNIVTMKTLNNGDMNDIYFVPAPVVIPPPAPVPAPAPVQNYNNTSGGVTVTPNVTVQPNNGGQPAGSVTVQPGLNVTPSSPTTQPSQAPSLRQN